MGPAESTITIILRSDNYWTCGDDEEDKERWTGPSKTFRSPRAGPVSTGSVETLCSLGILEISTLPVPTLYPPGWNISRHRRWGWKCKRESDTGKLERWAEHSFGLISLTWQRQLFWSLDYPTNPGVTNLSIINAVNRLPINWYQFRCRCTTR